jgi:hypothetical protein
METCGFTQILLAEFGLFAQGTNSIAKHFGLLRTPAIHARQSNRSALDESTPYS